MDASCGCTYVHTCVYKTPRFSAESQGFTKDQKNTKTPRVTDEGWISQKQLSGPVEGEIEVKGEISCILIQSSH